MADLVIAASLASVHSNHGLHVISSSADGYALRLWAYEVRNSVLLGLRRGRITKADAETFLDSLRDLNIHLRPGII
jgi:hypothetical protein